ncbi:MAG: hypothetical protein ACOC45_06805 [Alkalispirochaetaceae bacterium]
MSIKPVTGANAVEEAMEAVRSALNDPEQRVFQLIGYQNIGKRNGVRRILEEEGAKVLWHNYTHIDYAEPIAKKVTTHPQVNHVWEKVYASNILHPEILDFFQRLQAGEITFEGTFILVANEDEFWGKNMPDLPGVQIKMSVDETLAQIEKNLEKEGAGEKRIENVLANADRKLRRHYGAGNSR